MTGKAFAPILFVLLSSPLDAANNPGAGGQLRQLRFSPDGQYLIAQDDSEIAVLAGSPLSVLFRIPAENTTLAEFTPDSREVVFISSVTQEDPTRLTIALGTPNVEHWRIHDRTRVASIPRSGLLCGTVSLSPDGLTVACDDFGGTLRVMDAATGENVLEKPKFGRYFKISRGSPTAPVGYKEIGDPGDALLEFSPDGRFLLAIPRSGDGPAYIWDVRSKRLFKPGGALRPVNGRFTLLFCGFVAPDRVLLASTQALAPKRYVATDKIVSVPDGRLLSTAKAPWAPEMRRAADSAFAVVVHPFYEEWVEFDRRSHRIPHRGDGAAAVELATGQMITSDTPALDVFGSRYVAEVRPGEIGLYERGKGLQATVVLHKK